MYIPPFLLGIISVIGAELIALIIAVIIVGREK